MNGQLNFNNLPADLKGLIFEYNRPTDLVRLEKRKFAHMRYYFYRWRGFAEKPYLVNFEGRGTPCIGIEYDKVVESSVKVIMISKFCEFCAH